MKITKTALLTIIFGMVISQAGWLVAGIALLRVIYVDKWRLIPEDQIASLGLLAVLSAVFLGVGVTKGRALARVLEKGKIVCGRLLKVKTDNSGEDTKYLMTFAYTDTSGRRQSLDIERRRNDLVLGDEFPALIDELTGDGLLELDLPGGTTFANFQGTQPIRPEVFLRTLVVPVLSLAPLLGLVPAVAVTLQHLVGSTGMWFACGWSVGLQVIWLFAKHRHFTFKGTHIGRCCENQTQTEKVYPQP
jgi:hypothetical protein